MRSRSVDAAVVVSEQSFEPVRKRRGRGRPGKKKRGGHRDERRAARRQAEAARRAQLEQLNADTGFALPGEAG